MQLLNLNCNNCGAKLDIDLDNLQAFCPYCGQKLMMDFEQLAHVLSEKEKTKRVVEKEEQRTKRTKMAYEHESREKDKDWKKKAFGFFVLIVLCLFAFYFFPHYMSSLSEKKHDEKVAVLQQLEIEIEEAIQDEDYDTAWLKANKLYYDDGWSSKEAETWTAKRETYLSLIEKKQRERDLTNPDIIFMPISSDSLNGKKYSDVVDQLQNLGFTNISTQVASDSAGLFNKDKTVEHVLIGGQTTFSNEDYFNKDTPIIVYYYSK